MKRGDLPVGPVGLPEGYSVRPYRDGDWAGWCRCLIGGGLGVTEIDKTKFDAIMAADKTVELKNILFLTAPDGRAVGTLTCQYRDDPGERNVHMFGVAEGYRGKGLSAPMLRYALRRMIAEGVRVFYLTTDDWRVPAIKTYLRCGFEPVIIGGDAADRWRALLDGE